MDAANIKNKTDFELVKLCVAGDSCCDLCFEELVLRYKNLVYSIVTRMTNDREEANDLAQEIFVKIYKNLAKYHPEYKFSTWIMRITTNHVIDNRRKKKHETISIHEAGDGLQIEAQTLSPEDEYIRKEELARLSQTISELPDIYKVPIVLYHQQGLSYQEIANVTDEPLSKVKNRIFRARKMLKEAYLV